jgi:hypothetical protein
LCQVWLKLTQWFWRRFLSDPTPFLHFCDYLPFEEDLDLNLNKLEFPSPKDNLYQVWLILEKKIFKYFQCKFLLFCYYISLEKGYPLLPLNNLESPSSKDDLCQVWLKLALWFWRTRFLSDPPHFYIFVIISPLKKTWPFIWTNLNSLHPSIICIKFDWIWYAGSGEEDFYTFQCNFTLSLLSPLGEGLFPSFEQTYIPFTQEWFVPTLVKIGLVVLEKKSKM